MYVERKAKKIEINNKARKQLFSVLHITSLAVATAFAKSVLPVPGGPKSRTPLGGARSPVNRSGLRLGRMTASLRVCFANSNPAISFQSTPGD